MKRILALLLLAFSAFQMNAQIGPGSSGSVAAPYLETFTTTAMPAGWAEYDGGSATASDWQFSSNANSVQCANPGDATPGGGTQYAWMDQSGVDNNECLQMPDVDISTLAAPLLSFQYYMCGVGYTPPNITEVEYWDGAAWASVQSLTGLTNGWELQCMSLTGLTFDLAGDSVRIRFRAVSGGAGADFYGDNSLDDIEVVDAPPCTTPAMLTLTPATMASCGTPLDTIRGLGINAPGCALAGYSFAWEESTDGGVTWVAAVGGTIVDDTTYIPPPLASGTIDYRLAVTCTASATTTNSTVTSISVGTPPTVSLTPAAATICSDGSTSATLDASGTTGATSYSWSPAAGLSATTGSIVTATPMVTTTYTVTAADALGCTATSEVTITVQGIDSVIAMATPDAVCIGDDAQLEAMSCISECPGMLITEMCGFDGGAGWVAPPAPPYPTGITDPIELTNTCPGSIDISGWQLEVTGTNPGVYTFPAGSVIPGNTAIILERDGAVVGTDIPGVYYNTNLPTAGSGSASGFILSDAGAAIVDVAVINNFAVVGTGTPAATATDWTGTTPGSGGTAGLRRTVQPDDTNDGADWTVASAANLTDYGVVHGAWTKVTCDTMGTVLAHTYAWTPPTYLSATNIYNPLATAVMMTTTYTVTATDANGCTATSMVTVTADPLSAPVATALPTTLCDGDSTQLDMTVMGGGQPYTYLWSPTTGITAGDETLANPMAAPSATTMYTCTVTDACMNTITSTVMVTVNPLPAVTATPAMAVVCAGDMASFTAAGADSYLWNDPAATAMAMLTITPTADASYTVIGTDAASGCTNTALVMADYIDPFYDTISAPIDTICEGESATLTAADSTFIAPFCVPTYSTGTGSGDFVDSVGAFGGAIANQTGAAVAPYYQLFPTPNPTVAAGVAQTVVVRIGTFGSQKIDVWIDFNQDSTFSPNELVGGQTVATAGASATFNFTIPTTALNGPTLMRVMGDYFGPTPQDPCAANTWGETEDYLITISGGSAPTPPVARTYVWDDPAMTAGATLVASPTVTTTYTVTSTDANGCTTTAAMTINVNPAPMVMATPASAAVCDGDMATFTASGADSYLWDDAAATAVAALTVTPTAVTTYTVIGTDAATGCTATAQVVANWIAPFYDTINAPMAICIGESATLMVADSGASTALPPFCASNATSTADSKIDSVDINGTATFTPGVPGAGETYTDNTSVVVPVTAGTPFPLYIKNGSAGTTHFAATCKVYIDFNQNNVFDLPGEEVYAFGPTTGFNTIPLANITIPATAFNGPTRMRIVFEEGGAATAPECGTYTWGETEDYTLDISGGMVNPMAPRTYVWDDPAMTAGMMLTVSPTVTTTYTATSTDANGCTATSAVTVTVNPLPVVTATPAMATVCAGDAVTYTAAGADTYFWDDAAATAMAMLTVTPTADATYTVIGTDAATGCTNTAVVMADYIEPFYDTINVSSVSICGGSAETVTLIAADSIPSVPLCMPAISQGTGFGDFIDSVGAFGGAIQNQSGASAAPYYTLFAAPNPTVAAGTPTSVTVLNGGFGSQTIGLWIDYNQDNVFSAAEYIGDFSNVAAAATVTFNFTIPTTALNGPTTMRVLNNYLGTTPLDPCAAYTYGEVEDYAITLSGASAPTPPVVRTYVWDDPAMTAGMMLTVAPTATTTYTVTSTDANGCTTTSAVTVTVTVPSGDLTQATVGNTASNPGTGCDIQDHPDDGGNYHYYDAGCNIIASVTEPAMGGSFGPTEVCAFIEPTVPSWNGQPFVPRHHDISPTNNIPGCITLYYTDADFAAYNGANGGFPDLLTNGGDAATTQTCCITQVHDSLGGTSPMVLYTSVPATWDATNMRWEVTVCPTGFSDFFLHTCNPLNAGLPVELTDFTVVKEGSVDRASWTTLTEYNNSHFNLQRSTDGENFINLGKIDSKAPNGNSSVALDYDFIDEDPQLGHNYYRLEQNDIDGQIEFSKIVDVIWGVNGDLISIYPNPTSGSLNVDIATEQASIVEVRIVDMSGRLIVQTKKTTQVGVNNFKLDLGDVSTGVYGVQVYTNGVLSHTDKVKKND